jgi:hypothetical protein
MKFNELLEAPQGFGSTLKTAAKSINPFSLSGRSQAQGQFKTGLSANQIYGEYYKWLGSTGQQPDTDNVLSYLQQKGYSQQAIAAAQAKFPQAPEAEPETPDATAEPTLIPVTTPIAVGSPTPEIATTLRFDVDQPTSPSGTATSSVTVFEASL